MLTIGAFSKISNVTTKTLRYYDEIGLIKPVMSMMRMDTVITQPASWRLFCS